jgi:hypothetical protein
MEYRTPLNPGFLGSQWRPKLAALLAFVLVNEIATEYLAWAFLRLGYFFESARFHIAGLGLYHPFCWIKWEVQYWRWVLHPTPPMSKPLWIAVAIFLIGGLLGSKLISQIVHTLSARALTKGMEHIYISSRWAKRKDLRRAGLLDASNQGGVVFGLWREERSKPARWIRKLLRIDDQNGFTYATNPAVTYSWRRQRRPAKRHRRSLCRPWNGRAACWCSM